jgi:hypothetical protein
MNGSGTRLPRATSRVALTKSFPIKSHCSSFYLGDDTTHAPEQFLEGFPSVTRKQVIALLEESRAHVLAAH